MLCSSTYVDTKHTSASDSPAMFTAVVTRWRLKFRSAWIQ